MKEAFFAVKRHFLWKVGKTNNLYQNYLLKRNKQDYGGSLLP